MTSLHISEFTDITPYSYYICLAFQIFLSVWKVTETYFQGYHNLRHMIMGIAFGNFTFVIIGYLSEIYYTLLKPWKKKYTIIFSIITFYTIFEEIVYAAGFIIIK